MHTYEEELAALQQWIAERDAIYDADTLKRMAEHTLARDSMAGYQNQLDYMEFRRRLRALRKKYGILD